jgi:8-oxo-dGTP pyrophosphatase MutT (NUDIX family)
VPPGPAGRAADELVDVVDADDHVVATVTRAQMRAENLRHRSVAIVVRAGDGRVLVHRRADDKDVWPGQWDLCVGGVVAAGESYDDAAARELYEELGVVASPRPLGQATFEDTDVRTITRLYEVRAEGPFRFPDGEIAEARLVDPAELRSMLATSTFVPDSRALALPIVLDGIGP